MIDPVVISGVGLMTPETSDHKEFYQRIVSGQYTGEKKFSLSVKEVQEFFHNRKDVRFARQSLQLGMGALQKAYHESKLESLNGEKTGIFYGECSSFKHHLPSVLETLKDMLSQGYDNDQYIVNMQSMSSFEMLKTIPNIGAYLIASNWGVTGPALTYLNGCVSGSISMLEAVEALKDGYIDQAVVLSGNGSRNELELLLYEIQSLFIENDYGSGEIGATLIMERESSALQRGVTPYARILGGVSSWIDLGNSDVAVDSLVQLSRQACQDAGVDMAEIQLINAMSFFSKKFTTINEAVLDQLSLKEVSSSVVWREHVGHTFAASGLVEVIGSLGQIKDRIALITNVGYGGFTVSLVMEGLM